MPKRRLLVLVLTGMALALVATGCEFPGPAVTVTFTSPSAGQRIVGARTVTVTGLISGTKPSTFSLTLNGNAVTLPLPTVGTFSASVTLGDGTNTLVATATASGTTSTARLQLYYPYVALKTGQAASTVVGQGVFTTANPGTTTSALRSPEGAPALVGGNLYLPDTGNNRVVGTTGVPSSNGTLFSILLGQSDYFTNAPKTNIDGNALTAPGGAADAGGNLVVADPGHNRVLLYQGAPTTANSTARWAVGQTSLVAYSNVTCDDVHLNAPAAAFVTSGGKLIVADTGHHRVLIWNSVPTQSGVPADLVLGQTGFGVCAANAGGTSAKTLSAPTDVWSDGARLVVADAGNNRVLIWNTFPTTSGQAANVVLGQAGMTTASAGGGASGLTDPRSLSSNGNQLFVADTGNNRVLIWNAFPTTSHQGASLVLGQADTSGTLANRGGASPTANTLSGPEGVRVFDGMVIVADTGNSRELIYRP